MTLVTQDLLEKEFLKQKLILDVATVFITQFG